jgi:hypothetical protein
MQIKYLKIKIYLCADLVTTLSSLKMHDFPHGVKVKSLRQYVDNKETRCLSAVCRRRTDRTESLRALVIPRGARVGGRRGSFPTTIFSLTSLIFSLIIYVSGISQFKVIIINCTYFYIIPLSS